MYIHNLSSPYSAAGLKKAHLSLSYMQNVGKLYLAHRDLCCNAVGPCRRWGRWDWACDIVPRHHTLNHKILSPPFTPPAQVALYTFLLDKVKEIHSGVEQIHKNNLSGFNTIMPPTHNGERTKSVCFGAFRLSTVQIWESLNLNAKFQSSEIWTFKVLWTFWVLWTLEHFSSRI